MKKIIILLIVAAIGWQAYGKYQKQTISPLAAIMGEATTTASRSGAPSNSNFRCDGRIHCSQMTSCEEATWFLRNCPGTKMDGNNDGTPCEKQWCK